MTYYKIEYSKCAMFSYIRRQILQKWLGFAFKQKELAIIDQNPEFFFSGKFSQHARETKERIEKIILEKGFGSNFDLVLIDEFNHCARKIKPIYGRDSTVLQDFMASQNDSYQTLRDFFTKAKGFLVYEASSLRDFAYSQLTVASKRALREELGEISSADFFEATPLSQAFYFWKVAAESNYLDKDRGSCDFWGDSLRVSCMRGEGDLMVQFYESVYDLDTYGNEPPSGYSRDDEEKLEEIVRDFDLGGLIPSH
ncbi:MAG: hypothetical protein H6860_04995 [Rhodospirillales bacterium]|nr:hypothetical protein [Alphaproteobacteria bacterium]MCB9981739.1 hypothetical protein [Rhodospirillales bacterium]